MGTVVKTNFLIKEVSTKIKQSYGNWHIGISDKDDIWLRNKWAAIIVYNVVDREATIAAFDHFVKAGMKANHPHGKNANYLYFYRADGLLPNGLC
jgi:hypothetical protein